MTVDRECRYFFFQAEDGIRDLTVTGVQTCALPISSSAQTVHDVNIPSQYFMKSDACQRCHADIYAQWNSSMHHFSSFNNQWYRKSIEYMQDVAGVKPSKWRSEEHTSELQSQSNLVCRLLLEKKKKKIDAHGTP